MPGPIERVYNPTTGSVGRGLLASPLQFFFGGEDRLELTCISLRGSVTIGLGLRIQTEAGEILASAETHTTPAAATWETKYFPIGRGYVLNAVLYLVSGSPMRGQCWVRLRLVRGENQTPQPLGTLLQGYLTLRRDLAFPGSPLEHASEGQGALTFSAPSIAVSSEWTLTVPNYTRWRVLGADLLLTTSAVVASRFVILYAQSSGGSTYFRSAHSVSVPASSAVEFVWAAGMPLLSQVLAGVSVAGLMDDLYLAPGSVVRTVTGNMQVGDAWGGGLYVEEWVSGDT